MTNTEFLKQVGMEIKIARIRKGLSRKKLAKLTGMSEAGILLIEKGVLDSKILSYKRIADALVKDVKEFLKFAE